MKQHPLVPYIYLFFTVLAAVLAGFAALAAGIWVATLLVTKPIVMALMLIAMFSLFVLGAFWLLQWAEDQ